MAVSRKRKEIFEISWSQNSRIFEGFHPLFLKVTCRHYFTLFRPLFLKKPFFRGVPRFRFYLLSVRIRPRDSSTIIKRQNEFVLIFEHSHSFGVFYFILKKQLFRGVLRLRFRFFPLTVRICPPDPSTIIKRRNEFVLIFEHLY